MANPPATVCCLNLDCPKPENPDGTKYCVSCGTAIAILRNHYRPIKLLSNEGGFGRTYLAEDLDKLREICVIKQLASQQQGTAALNKAQQLFELEARQLQKLGEHPQIPYLVAYFEEYSYLYLVQQYVKGKTLDKLLKQWNEQEVREFLNDILPVLEFVHRNNVIHRDIKPTNIMRRDSDGKYILIDFGASKEFQATVATRGTTIGTQGYAAYEQMESGEASSASDLFGIGATCFNLLTGVDPYTLLLDRGYQWVNEWQEHLKQPINPQFKDVLSKLLQKEPRNRYQSATEVLKDLNYVPPLPKLQLQPIWAQALRPYILGNPQARQQPVLTQIQTPPVPMRREFLKWLGYGIAGITAVVLYEFLIDNDDNPVVTNSSSPVPSPTASTDNFNLQTFSFKTVKVDTSGNIIKREAKQARQFITDLGNGITLEMVKVPRGQFLMGSPPTEENRDSDERQHEVTVDDFYIGKYEVTQEQWQAIMGNNPSYFNKGGKYPVETVSWHDCQEFCQKLSQKTGLTFRLPTEAEWEYACRAGTTTPFYCGETLSDEVANYYSESTYGSGKVQKSPGETTEVGSFPANAFGLYDIHGNVWEWCQDDYQENHTLNKNNFQQLSSIVAANEMSRVLALSNPSIFVNHPSQVRNEVKMLRGGSWDFDPDYCRSAYRGKDTPDCKVNYVGFRVVCNVRAGRSP